jgi:hypothetical protein
VAPERVREESGTPGERVDAGIIVERYVVQPLEQIRELSPALELLVQAS